MQSLSKKCCTKEKGISREAIGRLLRKGKRKFLKYDASHYLLDYTKIAATYVFMQSTRFISSKSANIHFIYNKVLLQSQHKIWQGQKWKAAPIFYAFIMIVKYIFSQAHRTKNKKYRHITCTEWMLWMCTKSKL